MRKYIFFDFDGTIVNSMGIGMKLYNEMAEKYNLRKLKEEEIALLSSLTISERIKMFEVPLYMIPKMIIEFKRKYQKFISSLHEIEGMKDIIYELKQKGYSLCIISSNTVKNIQQFLINNQLDVFDHVYSSRGIFGKHATLKTVSRKLKIKQEQIIYIGDELRDIVSCKKAGVEIISVTWGFDSAELLSSGNPNYLIHKPADILTIIQNISSQK